MHFWGDEWFKAHGKDLYAAINEIEAGLEYYGIYVMGKEKYGCYRDDFLSFWDGGFYFKIFPDRSFVGTMRFKYSAPLLNKILNRLHHFLYYYVDSFIRMFNRIIGLRWLVVTNQHDKYNKVFQEVCARYPEITDELVCDVEGYKYIVPGRYGDVDGKAIHDKYWKTL